MTYTWIEASSPALGTHDPIVDFRLKHVQSTLGDTDDRWWSILIDLHQTSLETFEQQIQSEGRQDQLRIPLAYEQTDRAIIAKSFLVAIFVTDHLLEILNNHHSDYGISSVFDGLITPPESFTATPKQPDITPIEVCRDTAVMAVIDDGIAIGHNLFRSHDTKSRVDYAAIMGATALPDGPCTIGRVLSGNQIDALLKDCWVGGMLDEQEFYRLTGQIDFYNQRFSPVSLRRSHGTHVTALAAGYRMEQHQSKRPILCVSLPPRVTEDTSGQSMLPAAALALQALNVQCRRYVIKDEGPRNGTPAPVVVNFSFGNFAGPHDGTGVFARLFEQFLTRGTQYRRRAVVLPAGNGNLSQTHAEIPVKLLRKKGPQDLNLVAKPDDRTATHLQVWMPVSRRSPKNAPVIIEVSPPGGLPSVVLDVDLAQAPHWQLKDDHGQEVARLSWAYKPAPTQRVYATLSLAPTASHAANAAIAPAGRWTIRVSPRTAEDVEAIQYLSHRAVECWIRRDETLPGFMPGGRQALFDDPHYKKTTKFGGPMAVDPRKSEALVKREGTFSGFATGLTTIVVGAATAKSNTISAYSASGPISENPNVENPGHMPPRVGPDAMARGDDSPVLPGVLSAGSASGSFVRMSGSSVAAPRVSRKLADLMVQYDHFDRADFTDWITGLEGPALEGPRYRGGGMPVVPVQVDFWDIPLSVLEPRIGDENLT